MSSKAARGTKRLCQGCGKKFYDLNRDPIICPLCETEFKLAKSTDTREEDAKETEAAPVPEAAPPVDPAVAPVAEDLEIDPELAAVEDEDLAEIEDVADADDAADAFLPEEDDGDEDVSEIIGDAKPVVDDDL